MRVLNWTKWPGLARLNRHLYDRGNDVMSKKLEELKDKDEGASRRTALRKLGKYAAVSAPAVTMLLATTTKPKVAVAVSAPPP